MNSTHNRSQPREARFIQCQSRFAEVEAMH
jgi:hypothetical protein